LILANASIRGFGSLKFKLVVVFTLKYIMSKLSEIAEKLKNFFFNYWLIILISLIAFVLLIILIRWLSKVEPSEKKLPDNVLVCPIRGRLKRGKYAANGRYSEEY